MLNGISYHRINYIRINERAVRGESDYSVIQDTGIHGIKSAIDDLKHRKVWLKSGAYIIIEQLESFNAIDVNTGKAINGKNNIKIVITGNNINIGIDKNCVILSSV